MAGSNAFPTSSHISSIVVSLSVTSTTSSTVSRLVAVSSTVSTTASDFTASSNSILSPGAEAGVGIGAASAVIILVALLLLFFRRRRRPGGRLLGQERHSPAPMDTIPEMETKANVHEISGKPALNPVINVLSKELSNEPPLLENNAAENDSYIVGNLPQAQQDLESVRRNLAEADGAPIRQDGLLQMHEFDSLMSVHGESGTGSAYQDSGAPPEAPGYSAQEIEATSFRPAVVHEMPNNLPSRASIQAQVSDVGPQDILKEGYEAPSPQNQVAQSPVNSKLITRKILPLSLAEDAQSGSARESSGSSRLDILRTRIDKVREEKERLTRLQELEYLEAELQREIMDEQRKELGTG